MSSYPYMSESEHNIQLKYLGICHHLTALTRVTALAIIYCL